MSNEDFFTNLELHGWVWVLDRLDVNEILDDQLAEAVDDAQNAFSSLRKYLGTLREEPYLDPEELDEYSSDYGDVDDLVDLFGGDEL